MDFILHGSSPSINLTVRIIDYGDENVFRSLWLNGLESDHPMINGEKFDWTAPDQQILIIGNEPPDKVFAGLQDSLRGINFRAHFTATSWLTAWKVKFTPTGEERKAGMKEAMARIAVIDSRATGASGAARALQAILGARDASGVHTLFPRTAVLNAPSLAAICQWLKGSKNDGQRETAPYLRDLLKSTTWNELTSNREQHHALSNVLGAFLLKSQVGSGRAQKSIDQVQEYMLALLQALGIDANLGQGAVKEHQGVQRWVTSQIRDFVEGAVLIDDMGDLWEYFLRGALGFAEDAQFGSRDRTFWESFERFGTGSFVSEIEQLPRRLSEFLGERRANLRVQDLTGAASKLRETFVLFLDLRLFPKVYASGKVGTEKRFLKGLACFGLNLLESDRNLPWLTTERERTALYQELRHLASPESLNKASPSAAENSDQTLLPRLISLLDPTLPIVIFSSTHRAELIDPFRQYGNIVTAFRKPIITGIDHDWAETVKELHGDFMDSMRRSTSILEARRMLGCLSRAGKQNQNEKASRAIEIFLDESLLNDFEVEDPQGQMRTESVISVGAVVCIAESHTLISEFCKKLEDASLHWGLSNTNRARFVKETRRPWADASTDKLECRRGWWIQRVAPDFKWLSKDAKWREMSDAADAIQRLADESSVQMFAISIDADPGNKADILGTRPAMNWDSIEADELHRELTKSLLQMLLVSHPKVAPSLKANYSSLAFDLGDRTHEIAGGREQCEQFFQRFGIRYTDQELVELTPNEERDLRQRSARNERLDSWKPKANAVSIDSDHAAFALREVLASLPNAGIKIERCRGVALMDFDALQGNWKGWEFRLKQLPAFPLQIHYLADWIARRAAYSGLWGEQPLACLKALFKGGFRQRWQGRSRRLLDLVISGVDGDRTVAIQAIATWLESNQQIGQGEQLLLNVASTLPDRLRSDELEHLFSRSNIGSTVTQR